MSPADALLGAAIHLRSLIEDERDGPWRSEGLCFCLDTFIGNNRDGRDWEGHVSWHQAVRMARHSIFESWPERSGSTGYPVCDPRYTNGPDSSHPRYMVEDAARFAFKTTWDKYEGEYGAARIRLLNHLIDTLIQRGAKHDRSTYRSAG